MHTGVVFAIALGVLFAGAVGLSLTANYLEDGKLDLTGGGCGVGGCSGGGGSCCGGGGTSTSDAEKIAGDYYIAKTGDGPGNFTVIVEDYGCHQEAEIIKDGNVVMTLTISNGKATEI